MDNSALVGFTEAIARLHEGSAETDWGCRKHVYISLVVISSFPSLLLSTFSDDPTLLEADPVVGSEVVLECPGPNLQALLLSLSDAVSSAFLFIVSMVNLFWGFPGAARLWSAHIRRYKVKRLT